MSKKIQLYLVILFGFACGEKEKTKIVEVPVGQPSVPQPQRPQPFPQNPPGNGNCNKTVSFAEISPLLTKYNCITCHAYQANYGTWQSERFTDDVIRRINLGDNDNRRMPPAFREAVSPADKQLFQQFQDDGRPEFSDCKTAGDNRNSFTSLASVERAAFQDLEGLDSNSERQNTRYATNCHQSSAWFAAMAKGLNSVSSSLNIIPPTTVDSDSCLYRIDLRAYGLTPNDWSTITRNDPFKFVSNTVTGKLLIELTGSNQPILHGDNFLNIIYDNPAVYYSLLRVNQDRAAQFQRLGVNPVQQLNDEEARVIGMQRTQIARNKNRMFTRYNIINNVPPGEIGFLWITGDIDDADLGSSAVNVFQNPLPFEANGTALYEHRAEEWLWTLPNGLMGAALYEVQTSFSNGRKSIVGVRVNAAPETTVINIGNAFRGTIQVGNDCLNCHRQGPIIAQDEVKAPVLAEGDLAFDDLRIVRAIYGSPQANATLYNRDRALFIKSMTKLRINGEQDDPINTQTTVFRQDWDAARLAPFFWLREDEFVQRLRNTQIVKQVPQLLTGGAISLTTLIQVAQQIADELEVYEDNRNSFVGPRLFGNEISKPSSK